MAPDGRLERRGERAVAPFIYAGVAIVKPELFADTPDGAFSLNLLFDRAIARERLYGLRLDGQWLHVGTPEAIQAAEAPLAALRDIGTGTGRIADPGFVAVTPGSGAIMVAPVSVCHQVSTIGHRPPPILSRNHIQASGLIGSPTVPSTRSEDRSYFAGMSSPHFMNVRISVGAV